MDRLIQYVVLVLLAVVTKLKSGVATNQPLWQISSMEKSNRQRNNDLLMVVTAEVQN
jgi:hypothetical protein